MDTKCVILKRVWSVVLAAAGLFTAPLSATLQAEEAASVTAKDAVAVPEARESVLADVTAGASARKVMKGSQTYVWDETNVIKVNSADELNSALSTSGDGHKSIRIMNSFDISIDITSSIDATIDLNGKTLSSFSAGHMILINNVSLSLFDGSADGDGRVDLNANTLFLVDEFSTLNIYGGKFSGFGEGSAVINHGTTNVYGGNFADLKKGIDNAAGTLNIYGGEFSGDDSGTGVYNSGTANVYGGKFENLVMGIYNAGSLNLYALPVVGAGNNANSTADIGLAPEKVITMSMVGSSLPENYEKMKVGQFTYAASSGYSAAGSAPYVVTSGYHANLKGIHPAQMFVAYDGDATDNVSYELCLKGGSDADAGEAQIAEVAGDDVTWTNPGGDGGGGGINILSLNNREWADGAVIRLNRNIDLGDDYLDLKPDDTRTSFTFDLNGHLLTGSPGGNGIFNIEGMKVTICDSGTGGMMAVNRGNSNSAVSLDKGLLTITGGSFFSEGAAIVNVSGTLSVTGGTLTGEGRAVRNDVGGTADISGGTFFGSNGDYSAIENAGTMTLGCGDGAVSIIGGSGPPAVGNSGTLTVGSHASIKSSGLAAISNPGTLNVAGFPSFDAANACDVMLSKLSNGTNSVISFTGDITAAPAAPLKVTVADGYFQPVALGDEPLLITSGYGAHVRYASGVALAGLTRDAAEVFALAGHGDGASVGRARGEAAAYAGSVAVASVAAGGDTRIYYIGSREGEYASAIEALKAAAQAADAATTDVTLTLLQDVTLSGEYLVFQNTNDAAGSDPARKVNVTFDLGGCQLAGNYTTVFANLASSLTVTSTVAGGEMLLTHDVAFLIYNSGGLTVKDVTLRVNGSGSRGIANVGTLTIDGQPKFLTPDGCDDILLVDGYLIGIGSDFALNDGHKIKVRINVLTPYKFTSGYGKTVRYPAEHTNAGRVMAPGEVFTLVGGGSDELVFAGGEAWRVSSGTMALIQTSAGVTAYTRAEDLASAVDQLLEDATVTLARDVDMSANYLSFTGLERKFTLDLGGHEISSNNSETIIVDHGALLDITDSGVGGTIKNTRVLGAALHTLHADVSIAGGVTFESSGNNGAGMAFEGGTPTFKGWPAFKHGENAGPDILISSGSKLCFADGISGAPAKKITISCPVVNSVTLTSGYGAHVTYPAGHEKADDPIDPDEVFTYLPFVSVVVSARPRLVGEGDAAEVEFWLPKATVAYVDADGNLHDDLDGSTPETDDDGAEAYVLSGTETELGVGGEDTWYVALPADKNGGRDLTGYGQLALLGNVHLILADGAEMKAAGDAAIENYVGAGLTLYGQRGQTGVLTAEGTAEGSFAILFYGADLVINGGSLTAKGNYAEFDIKIVNGNLIVNGGTIFDTPYLNIINGNATINGGRLIGNLEIINPGQEDSYTDYRSHLSIVGGDIIVTGGDITGFILNARENSSTGGHVTISGGTLDSSAQSIDGEVSTTVSGGKIMANNLGDIRATVSLSLSNDDDYIIANAFDGAVTIPQGSYLGDGERVFGSADADYLFGADGHATIDDINEKTLVKATPLATGGLYLAYDNPSGASLLSAGTVALYPTGIRFTEQADGSFTAEVVLCDQPLPGIPQGRPVILASATDGAPLSNVFLMGSNALNGEGRTPEALMVAYDARTDRLINYVAADGKQTVAQLIAAATGRTAITDADCHDYIVFVLSGDRFVATMASPDAIPAAGRCLLVVPKLNMLRHLDMGDTSGGTAGARTLRLGGGDNATTGILQLPADGDATSQEYFGLDGRPVGSRPQRKGVYIRRGSKLIVR